MSSPMSNTHQIPSDIVVKCCGSILQASRGEDLEIEPPVSCRDCAAFEFHATLTRMLGPTLIRHQVIQVCQPREKRLLASTWMMEPLHRE